MGNAKFRVDITASRFTVPSDSRGTSTTSAYAGCSKKRLAIRDLIMRTFL